MSINCILVTGVAGFIGRYVARHFKRKGWAVIGVDTAPLENAPLGSLSAYYAMKLPHAEFAQVLTRHAPQLCIHCAGRASVGLSMSDPAADFVAGPMLTFEILNALRLNTPECKFIFISSAAVYGNPKSLPVGEEQFSAPLSPYGFHKWQCEIQCREFYQVYGLPTASVRIFSAYGPGLRRQVIWDICRKILVQKSLNLRGTGKESRDFVHALDIALGIDVIANAGPMQGEVYNLASGREVSILELASIILAALGSDLKPEFDGVVPSGTPLNWQADIGKLDTLGFTPAISLEEGLQTFSIWCRAELSGAL